MRYTISGLLLCFSLASQALTLTSEEMQNLGLVASKAETVNQTVSQRYPAKVAVPNMAQRIIHTTQEGVIINMMVAEGDVVKKDQLLATVNSPQLVMLQSEYLQAKSLLVQFEKEMKRDKQLFADGIIAERRYQQAMTSYQQQLTSVNSFAKTLKLAGMSQPDITKLASNRELTSHLNIYSSADGVVMQQNAVAGQKVSPADTLYKIADLSMLWLEVHVPISVSKQVKTGDRISVCSRDIIGQVTAVGRQVHEIDQGVLVRAEVTNHTDELTPGEYTEACFVVNQTADLFKIPRDALFRQGADEAVFIVNNDDVQLLAVKIVSEDEAGYTVEAHMDSESLLVVGGVAALKAAWLAQEAE